MITVIFRAEDISKIPPNISGGKDCKVIVISKQLLVKPDCCVCTMKEQLKPIKKVIGKNGILLSVHPNFGGIAKYSRNIINLTRSSKHIIIYNPDSTLNTWVADFIKGIGQSIEICHT